MKQALLFDIDGCLTLNDHEISVLDTDLMDEIIDLDFPVAFVTGRSDGWLKKQYRDQNRMNYLEIPTYIEFGLALIHQDTLTINNQAMDFVKIREGLIQKLAQQCRKQDILFQPDTWYDDYPSHGSLWVEQKHVMLSIASNTSIRAEEVHNLCQTAWHQISDVRVLNHHLGIDALPEGWSKSKATKQFLANERIDEQEYQWYVFGDNDSDREMMEGLSKVEFISTKKHASTEVRNFLERVGII